METICLLTFNARLCINAQREKTDLIFIREYFFLFIFEEKKILFVDIFFFVFIE